MNTDQRPWIDARDENNELVYRPMNDEEYDQMLSARDAGLAITRQLAGQVVLELLAATDKWAARAYEDGVPMSDSRKSYRAELRNAYKQIMESDDPASVPLPNPPDA